MPSHYMTASGVPVEVPEDETPEERRERERDLPAYQRTFEHPIRPGIVVDMGPANLETEEEKEEEIEEEAEASASPPPPPPPRSK